MNKTKKMSSVLESLKNGEEIVIDDRIWMMIDGKIGIKAKEENPDGESKDVFLVQNIGVNTFMEMVDRNFDEDDIFLKDCSRVLSS